MAFFACESAEDISNGMDHEVPSYKVLTDSLLVQAGQNVEIKVEIADNAGLSKVVFSYDNWLIRESFDLLEEKYPMSYTFTTVVAIPDDAAQVWEEDEVLNDGTTIKIRQQYHSLNLEVTDINMNVRNVPVYIRVE
jgi:hypothetical protein